MKIVIPRLQLFPNPCIFVLQKFRDEQLSNYTQYTSKGKNLINQAGADGPDQPE